MTSGWSRQQTKALDVSFILNRRCKTLIGKVLITWTRAAAGVWYAAEKDQGQHTSKPLNRFAISPMWQSVTAPEMAVKRLSLASVISFWWPRHRQRAKLNWLKSPAAAAAFASESPDFQLCHPVVTCLIGGTAEQQNRFDRQEERRKDFSIGRKLAN